MATLADVRAAYEQYWGYVPERFKDDRFAQENFTQSYLDYIKNNAPSGSGTSSGSSATSGTSSTTSSAGQTTDSIDPKDQMNQASGTYSDTTTVAEMKAMIQASWGGATTHPTSGETLDAAAQRITNAVNSGTRSLANVQYWLDWNTQNLASSQQTNVAGDMGKAEGTFDNSNYSYEQVYAAIAADPDFQQMNQEGVQWNGIETVEQAATRIWGQLQSGTRSWDNFTYWLGQSGTPNPEVSPEFGGLGGQPFDTGGISALPQGSKLVRVGSQYRVVWGLGPGLGYAWYTIQDADLTRLFGSATPVASENFTSANNFNNTYGDNYWGDVSEISLTADTPWADMTDRIFSQFGYVAGMDTYEVKQLLIQAYFEGWSAEEFVVHYKSTEYYNGLTDLQRQWGGLSEAEKAYKIQETASKMAERYRQLWGTEPPGGIEGLKDIAEQIASGVMPFDQWAYETRQAAVAAGDTPAALDQIDLERRKGEPEVNRENLAAYVEQQWRDWVGPYGIPSGFAAKWGEDLYMNRKSQADLENYLKSVSSSYWANKPPDVSWTDWSAPVRGQIQSLLEVPTLEDSDQLLSSALTQGLTGHELTSAIRQDPRFLKTNRMYSDLSKTTTEIGRMFGFVS